MGAGGDPERESWRRVRLGHSLVVCRSFPKELAHVTVYFSLPSVADRIVQHVDQHVD